MAIESANEYLKYLKENNKGVQEIGISKIEFIEKSSIYLKLNLSGKLFDIEGLLFKNLKNGKQYDLPQIKVVEYDNDKNILLVKVDNTIKEEFKNLNKADLKVFSDLKFLITRVRDWYQLNGVYIKLPQQKPNLEKIKTDFFFEQNLLPSKNQIQSIKNALSQPFSYIWGAPGTGKTQIVLAYAVLNYITRNKTVAILAPTNNAIEQVLRGIIKMTDKACIDRKNILRLGIPTRKFAQEFPEVCEEQGLQKKLKEIDNQISILKKVSNCRKVVVNIKYLDELNLDINLYKKNKNIYLHQNNKQKEILVNINILNKHKERLVIDSEKYIKKINTLMHHISNYFFHSTELEDLLKNTENDLKKTERNIEELKYAQNVNNKAIKHIQNRLIEIESKILQQIEVLKKVYSFNNEFEEIVKDINVNNWLLKKREIEKLSFELKEQFAIDSLTIVEYKDLSTAEIEDKLKEHYQNREKITVNSSEERLKTTKIIACTLDYYIGKYKETKLNVEHIFLDEAGYANIIKGLTLFNNYVPITFLGDHKQLSPVCEKDNNMLLWSQSAIFIDYIFSKSIDDFKKSNFTSFNLSKLSKTTLTSTFRFGNNLAKILDSYIYKCGIHSATDNTSTKIYFMNAPKTNNDDNARESLAEVKAIKNIVNYLKQSDKEFVILTPYRKQRKLLENEFPQERKDLKILTVHSSQGQEWDNVIFSVVDVNNQHKWFANSQNSEGLRVINTAISRAKTTLIIVCDKDCWINAKNQLITDLLKIGKEWTMS